jgi:hypothetical protein
MTVPTCASGGFRDLGKAAKGPAVPSEAVFEHHHLFQFALPLAHEQRARIEVSPFSRPRLALLERTVSEIDRVALRSTNRTHSRLVEIA